MSAESAAQATTGTPPVSDSSSTPRKRQPEHRLDRADGALLEDHVLLVDRAERGLVDNTATTPLVMSPESAAQATTGTLPADRATGGGGDAQSALRRRHRAIGHSGAATPRRGAQQDRREIRARRAPSPRPVHTRAEDVRRIASDDHRGHRAVDGGSAVDSLALLTQRQQLLATHERRNTTYCAVVGEGSEAV